MDHSQSQLPGTAPPGTSQSATLIAGNLNPDEIHVDIKDVRVGMHVLRLDIPWEKPAFYSRGS